MSNVQKGLVYSYSRFSDPRQSAGSSTERQAVYAARWAAEHGLQLDTRLSLRDEGLSAYHQQHVKSGALGVFLRAVEDGRVPAGSVLIVEGLDRLSRAEPIQAQAQLAQIVNAGITVVTASDGKTYSRQHLKDNPMDLVYSLLVMIRAHEESDTKSKRVKASIRRLCEKWQDGSYRGPIHQGRDPLWCVKTDAGWALQPERAAAVLRAVELYKDGLSGKRIAQVLDKEGLRLSASVKNQGPQIYRVLGMRQLAGHKPVEVDGEDFLLRDYYPALLSGADWQELQRIKQEGGRRRIKGDLPHIITGIGLAFCGYCGRPMAGQHLATKPRLADGRIRDGYRRLLCASASAYGEGCPVPGSTSVAPVERALMSYCSDIINLQGLRGGDRTQEPRQRLQAAQAQAQELERQLDVLTAAMLQTAQEGTPLAFARKARQLEEDLAAVQREVQGAQRDLAAASHARIDGADRAWQELAAGVEAQDTVARLKARQLVADTFERITIWHHGVRPDPSASERDYHIDVQLIAKGGVSRMLRVDRKGGWAVLAEDFAL